MGFASPWITGAIIKKWTLPIINYNLQGQDIRKTVAMQNNGLKIFIPKCCVIQTKILTLVQQLGNMIIVEYTMSIFNINLMYYLCQQEKYDKS